MRLRMGDEVLVSCGLWVSSFFQRLLLAKYFWIPSEQPQ